MKAEIKNIFQTILFLFCLLPVWVDAADYTVSTGTSTVDGDTFCGGSACKSFDTIIIKGGARGGLKFQDFNGKGSYITITNENKNPNSKVEIDGMSGHGCLSLSNCKYVDLRGDNDGDLAYGIKVINDNTSKAAGSVWVYGKSDHIKISYLEITCEGNTSISGNGIFVSDTNLTDAWTFNNFEIHHNYIHDTRYSAMYLGHNEPARNDDPYIRSFSIHDNIMEDLGAYGITYKGVNGPNNYIYNNTINTTGLVPGRLNGGAKHGIGIQMFNTGYMCEVYDNRIENTVGPGIKVGLSVGNLIYRNTILGCGTGDEVDWGHGILIQAPSAHSNEIYDNIIIQSKRYGIYGRYETHDNSHKINLIGDSGIGEVGGTGLTEGTGDDANIYYSDVADFNFSAWSNDGNYSNDIFTSTIPPQAPRNPTGVIITEP